MLRRHRAGKSADENNFRAFLGHSDGNSSSLRPAGKIGQHIAHAIQRFGRRATGDDHAFAGKLPGLRRTRDGGRERNLRQFQNPSHRLKP